MKILNIRNFPRPIPHPQKEKIEIATKKGYKSVMCLDDYRVKSNGKFL